METWNALSKDLQVQVRFQWQLCQSIWQVLRTATTGMEREQQAGEISIRRALKLIERGVQLRSFTRQHSPVLPAVLGAEPTVSENFLVNQAPDSESLLGLAASNQKTKDLVCKVQCWQQALGLREAA